MSAALLLTLLVACAAPSQYMGIGFAPGAAPTELQALALRAQAGDKQAQLDLGIAYEEGRGVSVDRKKARNLYRLASADTGGTTWVYVPSTRTGETGRVTPVNLGVRQSGLREAKERFIKLGPQSDSSDLEPALAATLKAVFDIKKSKRSYMALLEKRIGPSECKKVVENYPIGEVFRCDYKYLRASFVSATLELKQPFRDRCTENHSMVECEFTNSVKFYRIDDELMSSDRCITNEIVQRLLSKNGWILGEDRTSTHTIRPNPPAPGLGGISLEQIMKHTVTYKAREQFFRLKSSIQSIASHSKSIPKSIQIGTYVDYVADQDCISSLLIIARERHAEGR
jgi:hypothetical protein